MPVIVVTRLRLRDPALLDEFFTDAVAALVALRGLRRGVQQDTAPAAEQVSSQLPGEDPDIDLDTAGR